MTRLEIAQTLSTLSKDDKLSYLHSYYESAQDSLRDALSHEGYSICSGILSYDLESLTYMLDDVPVFKYLSAEDLSAYEHYIDLCYGINAHFEGLV